MKDLEVWKGIVRHALSAVGGYLTGAGYMDDATAQAAIGAGITLFGVVWSIASKRPAVA